MVLFGREECGKFKWLFSVVCFFVAVVYCFMIGVECCDLEFFLDVVYCFIIDLFLLDSAFELEEDLVEFVFMCLW